MGPILGSELEGLKATEYPLITSSIDLSVGTRFSSWEVAEYYLKEYGSKKVLSLRSIVLNITKIRHQIHVNVQLKKEP